MDADRERELLGLIEAYWRIRGLNPRRVYYHDSGQDEIETDAFGGLYPPQWAESESCLREVAGECAVREAEIEWFPKNERDGLYLVNLATIQMTSDETVNTWDESRPTALLRAFVAAFQPKPDSPKG